MHQDARDREAAYLTGTGTGTGTRAMIVTMEAGPDDVREASPVRRLRTGPDQD